ncbi:MAG: TldD/PmbA family protein [Candidatus Cloacimonetes bacterium]|nr:TldD/PmbA family protein [Candidatus Cloacimonadota bacterium]
MEKLLKIAAEAVDQAEVFYFDDTSDTVSFNDAKLDKANTSMSAGLALRVIKNGKMGLAHTRNLLDPKALLKQAIQSAENGTEVNFRLPLTKDVPEVTMYDAEIEKVNKNDLIAEGRRIIDYISAKTDGQIDLGFDYSIAHSGIMNSAGTSLSAKSSEFSIFAMMIFPGTGSGLFKFNLGKKFTQIDRAELDNLIELYILSKQQVVPDTAKMPVILAPTALHALLSRFFTAASPINMHNKVSPLCGRLGEQIVSDKFSLWQDPFDTEMISATSFDSEGTPTKKFAYIDKGIFTAFPTDLNYAEKLGIAPTGNGFRGSVEALPAAQAFNYSINAGSKSLKEMISGIEKGILAHSLMGAHSGNVLNGDYSVGVATGFYIENGVIKGRVKDCMISGNAYDTLSHIVDIENKLHNMGSSKLPSIMFDGVSVAGK